MLSWRAVAPAADQARRVASRDGLLPGEREATATQAPATGPMIAMAGASYVDRAIFRLFSFGRIALARGGAGHRGVQRDHPSGRPQPAVSQGGLPKTPPGGPQRPARPRRPPTLP